jgi:UrcA family protein
MLLAPLLATLGWANGPALAQPTAERWRPRVESIIVRAAPPKNWRLALSASRLGQAFLVSASIPVPYSDLDLAREQDATEMGRRIRVAAQLVCQQLDNKYPPAQYPIVEGYSGYDCARMAAKDGMEHVDMILASIRR